MNRQAKRMMAKSGMDKPRPSAERREAATQAAKSRERTGPRQYLSEVRGEMKKVAWPSRAEVQNSTIIVLVAVVFMATLIFGYDFLSAKSALWLFD
jgi:preprotein translocase subunit SecE